VHGSTKQEMHQHAEHLAENVPYGVFDSAEHHDGDAGSANIAREPIADTIDEMRIARIEPFHEWACGVAMPGGYLACGPSLDHSLRTADCGLRTAGRCGPGSVRSARAGAERVAQGIFAHEA
jgi:hypothetical protein